MAQLAQRGGAAQPACSSSGAAHPSQVEADPVPVSPSRESLAPSDQPSGDSFGSGQRDDGSHPSEEEPSLVKCTLLLMSGEVLTTTYLKMEDERLSMGHFFHLAKTSLSVSECEIRLAIGRTTLTAQDAARKFFALQEVQDMMGEHAEVKINVVRVDPRNED